MTPERFEIELIRSDGGVHGTIRRQRDAGGEAFESWLDLLRLLEDPNDGTREDGTWQR